VLDPELTLLLTAAQSCLELALASLVKLLLLLWVISRHVLSRYIATYRFGFYSASAFLAMHTAVIAQQICPSVYLSVRLSVTFRRFVQKNEDTIV